MSLPLIIGFVACTAVAEAHVTILPRESKPGATEQYSMRVPTEGQVVTTSIELDVPTGVTIASVEAPVGSQYETTQNGDRIVTIAWRTEIKSSESQQFRFTATNPSQGTQIAWKVRQRYADGTSSDWVGIASSRTPAPVTKLAP